MLEILSQQWDPRTQRLVADGAWGTEIMNRGLKSGDAAERLNVENAGIVKGLAADYVRAGADIVLSNSFAGSRFQLERHGLGDRVTEINRLATEISAQAVRETEHRRRADAGSGGSTKRLFGRPIVAASIGPSTKLLAMGDVTEEELFEAFSEQASALKEGGADWILVESMTDLQEAAIAVRAAAETGLTVVSTMVYEKMPQGYRTVMGNDPETSVKTVIDAGAKVVGANCGTGIEDYMDLAGELCDMDAAPVWIKPNAGMPELENNQTVYRQKPKDFASFVPVLLDAGVSVVGGCCGTNPDFIAEIRRVVDEFNGRYASAE